MKMIKNKKRAAILFWICLAIITLTACGIDMEIEKVESDVSHTNDSNDSTITSKELHSTPPANTNIIQNETDIIEESTTGCVSSKVEDNFSMNSEVVTSAGSDVSEISNTNSNVDVDLHYYDITTYAAEETTSSNIVQAPENSEVTIYSDDTLLDDNNEEITYTPVSPSVSGDGNVLLIAALMEQMGNDPLRVSRDESSVLIQLLNEIEMQTVDSPDPLNIPYGGGYVMEIEGESTYRLLGGRYIQIDDSYFYDTNGKSEELSAKIGDVLYSYYGEPK